MPTDKFSQIKLAVADLIEQQTGMPVYTDRYLEPTEQRFAVVYLGEWSEEHDALDEALITGSLHIEVFAMNDGELSGYVAQLRPLLKQFDSNLLDRFLPTGGEYPPEENGVRPSVILNYSIGFYES